MSDKLRRVMDKNSGFHYFMVNYSTWVEWENNIACTAREWIEQDYSDETVINMVITEVRYLIKKIGEGSLSYATLDLYLDVEMLLEVYRRYNESGSRNKKVTKAIEKAEKDWETYTASSGQINDIRKLDKQSKENLKQLWYFHEDVSTYDMGYADVWMVD